MIKLTNLEFTAFDKDRENFPMADNEKDTITEIKKLNKVTFFKAV